MKKSGECKGNLRSAQKIFRVMKMLCFLMFVFLLQVRGEVIAQNQVVSMDLKNCNVEEFLREVKDQTGSSSATSSRQPLAPLSIQRCNIPFSPQIYSV